MGRYCARAVQASHTGRTCYRICADSNFGRGFRAHGYDGIVYKSLLGDGLNIALFDCDAAELINCGLYETNAVSFKFDQCGNPYFIAKHHEELQKIQAHVPKDEPAKPEETR